MASFPSMSIDKRNLNYRGILALCKIYFSGLLLPINSATKYRKPSSSLVGDRTA